MSDITDPRYDVGLNPLNVSFDEISHDIIGIHDTKAERKDVDSLYKTVSKIVKSSSHVADSIDFKGVKTVPVVEENVPEFMPSFSMLKEIACQMTCKSFTESTAHRRIKAIFEKLKSYTWDAKAVIALVAFALDYGESWRLSLIQQQANRQNPLELHVFRLGGVEPTPPIDQLNTLVNLTLPLIDKIITLEKKIAENSRILKESLSEAKREVYTYWAIFALACASQITQQDWSFIPKVHLKLNAVHSELDAVLKRIKEFEAGRVQRDRILKVIRSSPGILELLKALIIFLEDRELEIFDIRTNEAADLNVIRTQNLFLFISGLDNIDREIKKLESIANEIERDQKKGNYRILWIPVVEIWTEELKQKFNNKKSKVRGYVPKNYEPCKDIGVIQKEFHYNGKPIVVVTNPRGQIIHKNAMHMIFVWGIKAFPFQPDDERRLSAQWNWLWSAALKFHSDIANWVDNGKYIFLYRGQAADKSVTPSLAELIRSIKEAVVQKYGDTSAEHFDCGGVDGTVVSEFWDYIDHTFYNIYVGVKDKTKILSLREKNEWFLVSKGPNVLLVESDISAMRKVLQRDEWKSQVEKGFEEGFIKYYERNRPKITQCRHLKLNDIRSGVPKSITCPDCDMTMVIESVRYTCCHGNGHSVSATNAERVGKPNAEDIIDDSVSASDAERVGKPNAEDIIDHSVSASAVEIVGKPTAEYTINHSVSASNAEIVGKPTA